MRKIGGLSRRNRRETSRNILQGVLNYLRCEERQVGVCLARERNVELQQTKSRQLLKAVCIDSRGLLLFQVPGLRNTPGLV